MDKITKINSLPLDLNQLIDTTNSLIDAINKIQVELKDCVHISHGVSGGSYEYTPGFPMLKDPATLKKEQEENKIEYLNTLQMNPNVLETKQKQTRKVKKDVKE